MKKTQIEWVKQQLRERGEVSRNQCLANYISRLSAIIQNLEEQGYQFDSHKRDGDWVYKLVEHPTKIRWVYDYDPVKKVRVAKQITVPL